MRLRKPCEHDRYEAHDQMDAVRLLLACPGGEFLDAVLEGSGMKVWYCEKHQVADADQRLFAPGQDVIACYVGSIGFEGDCLMVEKQLIANLVRDSKSHA